MYCRYASRIRDFKVLKMKAFEAGGLTDYEEKARVAAKSNGNTKCNLCSPQRPDEFGHDGDAIGKMKNIEEIDQRFFKTLSGKYRY